MQQILGFSPLKSGFAFPPFTAGIIFFAGVAPRLLSKIGPKPLVVPGLIFAAIGLLLLMRINPETSHLRHVVPSLLFVGVIVFFFFIKIGKESLVENDGVVSH